MEQQDGSWHSHGFQDPLLTAAREIGGQPLPPQTHCPTPPAPPFLNQHKFLHPFTPPLRSGLPEAVCRDVWRCGRHCFGSDAAGEQTLGCPMEADGLPSSGTRPSSGAGLSVLGNYLSFSTAFVHRSVSSHHPPLLLPSPYQGARSHREPFAGPAAPCLCVGGRSDPCTARCPQQLPLSTPVHSPPAPPTT